MKKKFFVQSLIIEVTRKCNANCPICLRGDMENKDMDFKYVKDLFQYINGVDIITFSGGEPTLNVGIIRDTLNYVKENNITVYSVFVVTNGVVYSQELVNVMFDWLMYCCETNGYGDLIDVNDYLENSCFGLALSIDKFHPTPSVESAIKYRSLAFYSKAKEHSLIDESFVLPIGKANENSLGKNFTYHLNYEFYLYDYNMLEELYLNIQGNVYPCCDFSYEIQDEVIGNVNISKRTLNQIIEDKNVHYDYFNYDVQYA